VNGSIIEVYTYEIMLMKSRISTNSSKIEILRFIRMVLTIKWKIKRFCIRIKIVSLL
jgi:hypothetical protein